MSKKDEDQDNKPKTNIIKFPVPKKPLSEYFNIEELKQIQRNALSKGATEYAEAVENRIREINDAEFGVLGTRFFKSIEIHEANLLKKHGKSVRANFIRRMVKENGIFETINRLVSNKNRPTQGFEEMVGSGDAENTLEQIVIDHPELFPEEIVLAAKSKLGK